MKIGDSTTKYDKDYSTLPDRSLKTKIYPNLLARIYADEAKLKAAKYSLRFNDFLLSITGTFSLLFIIVENTFFYLDGNS
ncbi:MAG: hypothetical protein V2I33_19555 [Kangiellaceae bacterium]|jgi:hypothetical protein|nr:hypothetical protein [Kangiellaceae bacterium]